MTPEQEYAIAADVRAIAAEVCDLWDDDEVDDDAMSNLIVRLRKALT